MTNATNELVPTSHQDESGSTQQDNASSVTTPSDMIFAISHFKHERDNDPVPVELPWNQICKILSGHEIRQVKLGGRCWSPARYRVGATRGNAGVIDVSCAVIDSDNGASLESIEQFLQGYAYLIHTSFRHTPEKPKLRIIVPFATPVAASDWEMAWEKINQFSGGINDPATKDSSRLYFLRASPADAAETFVRIGEGRFLNVAELPEPVNLPVVVPARKTHSNVVSLKNVPFEGIDETPNPKEGLVEVVARCNFMAWAGAPENQQSVSEPFWMAMISNACRFETGDDWIHEASCYHDEYDEDKTQRKIDRSRATPAPQTCQRIRDLGFGGCPAGGCPLRSGIQTKAPAGLWAWICEPRVESASEIVRRLRTTPLAYIDMPVKIADFYTTTFPDGMIFLNQSFYAYENGYHRKVDVQTELRREIALFLADKASSGGIEETISLLSSFLAVSSTAVAPNKALICLANGTLDTDAYELLPHSPEHQLTVANDIAWNPAANCHRWLQFMNEIFAIDIDKQQKIDFMQEWFGYCLVPDASQHKFVWMVGAGGNGKSVLLFVLAKIVGEVNVSHAMVERLDSIRVRAELDGKLVNISSEMSAEATISDGYLKSIVAGDVIEAERKYQPSFSFRPFVRMIGATNQLPRLLDLSDGFARRAVVIGFNRQFTGEACDPRLEEKLIAELPGILVWAVEGLRRLRERGQFVIPQSSDAALAQYRKESDPVALFVDECLDKPDSDSDRMMPAEIYAGYVEWNRANGYRQMNKGTFGKRLASHGFESGRSGGKNYWLAKIKDGSPVSNWYTPASDFSVAATEISQYASKYQM